MMNDLRERTVLVVAASADDRALLAGILEPSYRVETAASGAAALALSQTAVDVLLLDVSLPDMDGLTVLEKLRQSSALHGVPALMLCNESNEAMRRRAYGAGALGLLFRPFEAELVLRRVDTAYEISQYQVKKWRDELARASDIDAQTGVWNRHAFLRGVRRLLDAHPQGRYVLARWDIDRFKVLNDVLGVAAGDALLAGVGRVLRENRGQARADGMLAYAHLDADHFVALWDEALLDAEGLYWHTLQNLNNILPNYNFSISYGFYRIEDTAMDVLSMCDRALLALLAAKHDYKSHYLWYDDSMRMEVVREQELTAAMPQSLANGEFVPFYQPQYNYDSGELLGAEALVRWLSPTQGLIPPGRFIPVFERNGFIYELDRSIWRQACAQLRKWLDDGLPMPSISVNVSRRDLYGNDLSAVFLALIQEYDLKPFMLRLEITESAYMDNPEQLVRVVEELQSHGFHVEMDDFGSGYSSLNTLKDVPVDMLKLDMKFVAEDAGNTRGGSILSSVVRMAHAIHLPVLAEGVETRQQADYLKSIGCLYMQGYLFSKPLPAAEMEALLRSGGLRAAPKTRFHPGVDGAADFLNASTQSTLLFNSFVGGAGIAEYENGSLAALRLNDKFFEVLGTTRENYAQYQYHMLERLTPESRQALLAALDSAIQTEEETHCELCSLSLLPDAPPIWTFCRFRCLAEKERSYIFYFTLENITERKRLTDVNDMYGNIIRNLPVGVAVYELDGGAIRPTYVNDVVCQMFGYTQETYISCFTAGVHPDHGVYSPDSLKRLLAGEVVKSPPLHMKKKDGDDIYVRTIAHSVLREGKPPLCYTTLIDVTQQLDAEKQIADQQEKLDESQREALSLIKNTPGGILRMRVRQGVPRADYVSEGFCALVGYTAQELLETDIATDNTLVHPDDIARLLPSENETLVGMADFHEQYRLRRKSGEYVWVSMRASYVGQPDDGYIYASYMDISDLKRLEQQLADEKLEIANLINAIPGGVATYEVAPDGLHLLFASEGVAALSGRTPEEYRRVFNTERQTGVYPPDEPAVLSAIQAAVFDGRALDISYRIPHNDGSLVWVNLRGHRMGEHNGHPVLHAVFHGLSASTDLYQRIINETDSVLLVADRQTKEILFINDAAARLAGRTKDEAIGMTCHEYLNHQKDVCSYCVAGKLGDKPMCQEIDMDSRRYFTRLTRIDWNGRDAFICYMTDRTDAYRAQQRVDAIIRNIPSGLAVYRVERGQIERVYLSEQAFDILGYEPGEQPEQNFGQVMPRLHPDDIARLEDTFTAVRKSADAEMVTGREYQIDFRILMPRGGVRWVQLTAKTVVDGGVLYFYCICTNITAQKAEEETERLTTAELNDAIENAPGGVCRWRLTKPFFIEFVSEGFCRMTGYSHEELRRLTQRDAFSLIVPEDRDTVAAALTSLAAKLQTLSVEYRYHHKDSSVHFALDTLRSVLGDDGVIRAYGQIFDVTERRVAQENLRVREEEYRIGVEQSGKIIFRYLLNGRRMDMPDQMERQFGLDSPVDNAPDAFVEAGLVDPGSLKAWQGYFAAVDAGARAGTVEVKLLCTDGKYHWFSGEFTGIQDSTGKPISAIHSYEDITDQRQYSKHHEFEYSALYAAMRTVYPITIAANLTQNSYYMLDYENFYSKTAAESGTFDQLIADGVSTVADEDKAAFGATFCRENLLAAHARGEDVVRLEHRQLGDDGVWRWMETLALHVPNPYDSDVLEIAVARVIDEQKATEAKLKDALEITSGKLAERLRYGNIINRVAPGLVTVRYIGNCSDREPFLIGNLAQALGYTNEELIELVRRGTSKLTHPEDAEYVGQKMTEVAAGQPEEYEMEYRVQKKDGDYVWLATRASRFVDENGDIGYVATYVDETERRTLTDELRASREGYRQVIENSEQLIYTYNIADQRAYLPERMRKLLGLPSTVENVPDSVLAQGAVAQISVETYKDLYASIRAGKPCEGEWLIQRKTNRSGEVWLKTRYILAEAADGRPLTATIYMDDVTASKRKEDELLDRAERDGMTGLYNRATAEECIKTELSKGGANCVLLLFDLDNLKGINDSLGHEQGDRALKAVADTLAAHFRRSDIVGRLGGDEFVAFLPDASESKGVRASLSALLRKLSLCAVGPEDSEFIHCSVGAAQGAPGRDDFAALYKKADTALYHVKRNGKNNFAFYSPDMERQDFQYKSNAQLTLPEESAFDPAETRRLLNSIASVYPMVVSANLSKNYYYLMECGAYLGHLLPSTGSVEDFIRAALPVVHPDDRQTFASLTSRESLLKAHAEGNAMVEYDLRRKGEDGSYAWFHTCILPYQNEDGDICEFTLVRPSAEKEREQDLLKLYKIMELAITASFEYICLLHTTDGTYELYGNDGKNTHAVPRKGDFDKVTAEIRDHYILPEEREQYFDNAVVEHVFARMNEGGGHYRYRYSLKDGVREAEFYWYEPTHSELLMTVKRVHGVKSNRHAT